MSKKLSLIGLIFVILLIIFKGTIGNFINPTLVISVYVSVPILILFLISDFRSKSLKQTKKSSFIFIIPIVIGIIGCNGTFSQSYTQSMVKQSFTNKNTNSSVSTTKMNENTKETEKSANTEKSVESEENTENIDNVKTETESIIEEQKVQENGKVINVNDDNYIETLNKVYDNIDSYLGTTIKIEGCIFRDDYTMLKNQFGAGKYYMYCCAVDMSLCGFLFEYDNYNKVETGKWYKIEAVVDKHDVEDDYYGEFTEPLLMVKNITEISKPKNTMVYYNY